MSQRLPEQIEPIRLAEQGRMFKGQLPIAGMKRLVSLLAGDAGLVDVDLQFAIDESGQANVTGHIEALVKVNCQRCMETMELSISTDVSLGIVTTEQQVQDLPSQYEPLMVEDEWTSLSDLVEDEMILALPAVSMHAPEQCATRQVIVDRQDNKSEETGGTERENPFAILEQLRKKK